MSAPRISALGRAPRLAFSGLTLPRFASAFWSQTKAAFSVVLASGALASPSADADAIRFAALGDLPYRAHERAAMPRWIDEIAATQPAFAIHVGDFKASRDPCTDETFADRHALFDASPVPFVYTPGDNEWSDCDLLAAGGYDVVERLARLRQVFFARPESLGRRKIGVEQQPGAPENLRWQAGGLVFLTLNLPAGNNHGPKGKPSPEMQERDPMIESWLREGFSMARRFGSGGVVIAFQANPGFRLSARGLPSAGFRRFLGVLQDEAARWGKPVLLIHGDTHFWHFDQPLIRAGGTEPMRNVWRVEVPGSPMRGWVDIAFDPARSDAPFSARMRTLE